MSIGVLLSAWLVGALGGVHCVAMCGGLLGALGARDGASARRLQPARTLARTQLAYHGGRIAMYTLLGAVFGGAGAAPAPGAHKIELTVQAVDDATVVRHEQSTFIVPR